MNKLNDSKEIILASTCLLLSIAHADENIEETESQIIDEILQDFFSINQNQAKEISISKGKETGTALGMGAATKGGNYTWS